jgi:hypothetical protein
MNSEKPLCVLLGLAACVFILSCSTAPVRNAAFEDTNRRNEERTDLKASYAQLRGAGEKVFALDPERSEVRIYAFRGVRSAKAGHNHLLSAPEFVGYFHLPHEGTSKAGFDLEFRLDQLELDNPAYRSRLGGAFASELTKDDIDSTRAHMLGSEDLQADQFPFVRIHSLQIVGEPPKFAAKVRVELHGRNREMWIPLNVAGLPLQLAVSGSFVLLQTDFDLRPFSVMGGLLTIEDEVLVEFRLVGN